MEWDVDRGLQVRMALALALVAIMPLAFVTTMTWALNAIVLPLAAVLFETGPLHVRVPLLPVLGLTLLGLVASYTVGDRLALRSTGARRVAATDRPDLHTRVDRLAARAGLPAPDLAVIDSSVPNAFATGRSTETATVAVMTVAYLLPTLTYYVAIVAYVVLSAVGRGFGRMRLSGNRDGRGVAAIVVLFVVTTLVTLTISAIFWGTSFLLFRLLSRYREYAADRGAAAITGEPLALAAALATIDGEMQALPDRDLRELDGGVETLYVSPLDVPMFTDERPHRPPAGAGCSARTVGPGPS